MSIFRCRPFLAATLFAVGASEFWQAYFDEIEKTTAGPLIDFKLEMEREVTGKSRGDSIPVG